MIFLELSLFIGQHKCIIFNKSLYVRTDFSCNFLIPMINSLKSVYLIATRDLSNLWLQFFLSQNQGFMRLFEKTVLK